MLEFFEQLTIGTRASSSTSEVKPVKPVRTAPTFYTESDEVCWRLLLLYCDYYALKIPQLTVRNPGVSKISRFFDHIVNDISDTNENGYLPWRIKEHVNRLESAFLHKMEKHWIFQLGALIQDWLIDSNTNRLRIEIKAKFATQFAVWPDILSGRELREGIIDNALCRAYAFMIVQCLFKSGSKIKTKAIGALFELLSDVDYCNPTSCQKSYEASLALKPVHATGLTINFDREAAPSTKSKPKEKPKQTKDIHPKNRW